MCSKVWYYKRKGSIVVNYNTNNQPMKASDTNENFPKNVDASFSLNNQVYYFFRATQYCKRPLFVDEDHYNQLTYGDWVQSYERPKAWYKIEVPESEVCPTNT